MEKGNSDDGKMATPEKQAREDFYNLLAENVKEFGMFITDPEGLITAWNPGAEHIMG